MSTPTKLIAAALVALAILLGVLSLFVGRRPPPAAADVAVVPVATFPVVIASRLLAAGQPITADAVRVILLPVQPTGAYTKVEEVVGHVPRVPIDIGLPLTVNGLAQGLTLTLKPGERGVAVPVDEVSGAGNAIQAGDYVDVFFTMKAPETGAGGGMNDRNIARLLISRARVLAYGTSSLSNGAAPAAQVGTPAPGTNSQAMLDQQRQMARSAVLAVPVEDVDALVLATQTGRLTLALRYPEDSGVVESALFQAPSSIVRARANLPAAERDRLTAPDNRAFAGLDSTGLSGGLSSAVPAPVGIPSAAAAPSSSPRRRTSTYSGVVEVIRGAEVSREAANGSSGRPADSTGQPAPSGATSAMPPPLPAGLLNPTGGAR